MIYALIREECLSGQPCFTVSEMCRIEGVSRSAYYRWLGNRDAREAREEKDRSDFGLILEAYRYRGYDKGVRGIYMRLLRSGVRMNHKKIRRLMHKYGLRCPVRKANPYRRMAKAIQKGSVADNLVKREFRLHGPRKVLLTDITYIPYNGTFAYLSVIKDAFTEQVLAYRLSSSLKVDFVLDTVRDLAENHIEVKDSSFMIHSDQGFHYRSARFQELIGETGLIQSMSRKGNCWDNAPQESFFGQMKQELIPYRDEWNTFEDVRARIDDWMDYYNRERFQFGLGNLAPDEYYTFITTGVYPA